MIPLVGGGVVARGFPRAWSGHMVGKTRDGSLALALYTSFLIHVVHGHDTRSYLSPHLFFGLKRGVFIS